MSARCAFLLLLGTAGAALGYATGVWLRGNAGVNAMYLYFVAVIIGWRRARAPLIRTATYAFAFGAGFGAAYSAAIPIGASPAAPLGQPGHPSLVERSVLFFELFGGVLFGVPAALGTVVGAKWKRRRDRKPPISLGR